MFWGIKHANPKTTNMKKLFVLAVAVAISANVSAQSSWRMGATIGSFGNKSSFSGGNSDASALFNHQKYGHGMWGVLLRKELGNHLSFQTGLNLSSLGFEYSMSKDYSLMQPFSQYDVNKTRLGIASIPATLIWNFNPNCKNVRWFVGAGLSAVGHRKPINETKSISLQGEGLSTGLSPSDNLTQTVSASSFLVLNGHIMFGVEKLFKRGTMLSLACYLNGGFTPVATSDVTYTVNGKTYNHSFTNYNNNVGLTLSYYFKPFGSKAVAKVKVIK